MYFLGPISWVLGKVADGAMATFGALFRWLAFWINELLYTMISNLYDVFIALCNGQLLDNDTLNGLFGRVGMLLGVVMMLRVAFSFIQMLIDPDSFSDKEKGLSKIVTKIIIVICMFGISGYVFEFLRDVQGEIIESNAIAKFFIPVQVNTEDFGGALSAELFTAFYNLDPEIDYSNDTTGCGDERFITTAKNRIIRDNDYSYARSCLLEKGTIQETGDEEYYINFNWIFSTVVAIFTLYFLLSYCISVGVRIVQLAVLQIISPMAIIGYLAPKSDNMFTKWGKLYFATYIDVFLRIAIINLVVYLCGVIMENWNEGGGVFWTSVGAPEGITRILIMVMMIMALLSFAKKAPELIKQLFPQSTSGLSLGLDKDNKPLLGAALGLGAGGAVFGYNTLKNAGSVMSNAGSAIYGYATDPSKRQELKNKLSDLKTGAKDFARADMKTKAKTLGRGTLGGLRTMGRGVKAAGSTVHSFYGAGKTGAEGKNPISSIYSAGKGMNVEVGTQARVSRRFAALQYIDDTISNSRAVKDAKTHRDEMLARYGTSDSRYQAAVSQVKQLEEAAFNNNPEVMAAREAASREAGLSFKDYGEFDKAMKDERVKNVRNWKIKDK